MDVNTLVLVDTLVLLVEDTLVFVVGVAVAAVVVAAVAMVADYSLRCMEFQCGDRTLCDGVQPLAVVDTLDDLIPVAWGIFQTQSILDTEKAALFDGASP